MWQRKHFLKIIFTNEKNILVPSLPSLTQAECRGAMGRNHKTHPAASELTPRGATDLHHQPPHQYDGLQQGVRFTLMFTGSDFFIKVELH